MPKARGLLLLSGGIDSPVAVILRPKTVKTTSKQPFFKGKRPLSSSSPQPPPKSLRDLGKKSNKYDDVINKPVDYWKKEGNKVNTWISKSQIFGL